MSRSILTWRIFDDDLVGTYHMPETSKQGKHTSVPHMGLLLLNSGPAPRSGNSDLCVHLGDRLASCGIPVFRFDLPGLGDSSGSTPDEFGIYWQEVLRGRNDAATFALVDKLKQQFGLSSVIIGGMCAAAVPTLRVADSQIGSVAGVILMEPAIRFGHDYVPDSPQANKASILPVSARTILRRIFSVQNWLRFLTGDNCVAMLFRPLHPLLVRVQLGLYGHTLHGDMNVPLFMHWRSIHIRGTHSLVVVAEGQDMDRAVSHVMESLPANGPGNVTLIRIPRTNHILTSGKARDIVLKAVDQWCRSEFNPGMSK